jgi:hypothetical protein
MAEAVTIGFQSAESKLPSSKSLIKRNLGSNWFGISILRGNFR